MSDLTEQWKKGELINGKKYYITFFNSEPFEATFKRVDKAIISYWKFEANGKQYCDENAYDCVKVLAPVPTFEELQNMNKAVNECMAANIKLVEENKQIKEILERHKKATAKSQIRSCDLEIINAQLKELLRECKEPLEVFADKKDACEWCPEDLLAKIDEVLK